MYKIYINESTLYLCSLKDRKILEENIHPDLVSRYFGKRQFLLNIIDKLEKNPRALDAIIYYDDFKTLKKDFKSIYKIITASGGLVYNEKDEILFIFRRGHWDLPKGKIEKGESKKNAAVREVIEETGIESAEIVTKIGKTHHTYNLKDGTRAIKKSHWYLMKSTNQPLIPQIAEDIHKAQWMTIDKFLKKERKVYRSIIEVLERSYSLTHPKA